MIEATDQELIQRVVKDDNQRAFSALVLRYQSQVRASLRRWAPDESTADDLAQESFLRAYQALPSFRGDAKFSTWIFRIAFNTAMSYRRKRGLELLEDIEEGSEERLSDNYSRPEAEALTRDIKWAMSQLTLAQQTLIDLCLHRGFSHQEAADITGMALGTVKSHVNRGKTKLMELMAPWEEEASNG